MFFSSSWKVATAASAFREVDSNGDGLLSVEELLTAVERTTGIVQPRARGKTLIDRFDENRDGHLDFTEFKKLLTYLDKGHNV